jgi:fluoroquinolone transport system permease protein
MTRLTSTMRWDVQLQIRNGFYFAAAFVALIIIILLSQFNVPTSTLAMLFPLFIFQNILINNFYFIAGLVLLEKGEGTLEGLVVTPLRKSEYLASKLFTLALLSLLETAVVVLFIYGLNFNILLLVSGTLLLSIIYALIGFSFVIRYDSINTFLLPSIALTMLLSFPLLHYLGIWDSPLLYLHPLQAPLLLLKGAFQPLAAWELLYGLGYSAVFMAIAYAWSHRAFYKFVILKEGVR